MNMVKLRDTPVLYGASLTDAGFLLMATWDKKEEKEQKLMIGVGILSGGSTVQVKTRLC